MVLLKNLHAACVPAALALVLASCASGQPQPMTAHTPPSLPAVWRPSEWTVGAPLPAEYEGPRVCANHGVGGEWSVRRLGDEVVITPDYDALLPRLSPLPPLLAARFKDAGGALRMDDGWLVSADNGEWGGGLWWGANDGAEEYAILDENVAAVVRVGEAIVAVTGLAHLTLGEGAVVELVRDTASRRWRERRRVALDGAPRAWLVERDSVLIVTPTGVTRYKDGQLHGVLRADVRLLYPSSIVRDEAGAIYIGMRFAVVRSGPGGVAPATWLYPPSCPMLQADDDDRCRCEGGPDSALLTPR